MEVQRQDQIRDHFFTMAQYSNMDRATRLALADQNQELTQVP
jgi:hypothetical protein